MIAALASNRVIGHKGRLPWRLPDDTAHFVKTTMGKPVIMGRKTFESMAKALAGRENIVVTSDAGFARPNVVVARSLSHALEITAASPERILAGGAAIYAEGLARADRLYLTYVHTEPEGDVHFPEFELADWREAKRIEHDRDDRHEWSFSIVTLERK